MSLKFEGTYTAIVTPFRDAALDADRSIDWEAYDRLVAAQIAGGITGIVPCGTTGESPSLDHEEQLALVKRTVKLAKGKCSVIAGTGANSTRATIALSQAAEQRRRRRRDGRRAVLQQAHAGRALRSTTSPSPRR